MKVELREMTIEDLQLTYKWRNDPVVRDMAMTSHEISYAEHEAMFHWNNSHKLIFELNEVPCGYVSCTKDPDSAEGMWAFHMASEARGKGLASIMLRLALMWLKEQGYKKIHSEVKLINGRSHNLHVDLGFKVVDVEDTLADFQNFEKTL